MTGSSADNRQCLFCPATFSRVDGARRHAKRCPSRQGQAVPERQRGRRVKSCDQCSRLKVHCQVARGSDCERCVSRGLDFTFIRSGNGPPPQHEVSQTRNNPGLRSSRRLSLTFLLNATDDKQDAIAEDVIRMEPLGVPLGPISLSTPQTQLQYDDWLEWGNTSLSLPSELYWPFSELDDFGTVGQGSLLEPLSPINQHDALLSTRLQLLESQLASYISSNRQSRHNFDQTAFRRFFNAGSVTAFATTLCRRRHYQYPILHWPTLALDDISPPLLLAISLTGAAYSIHEEKGEECIIFARILYGLAGAFIFEHLNSLLAEPSNEGVQTTHIQACQAALLIYASKDLLANDSPSVHTANSLWLPHLVAALRRFNFTDCRHSENEDPALFLRREQIIRTVAWTFCADCLATLCYNKPPSFSLQEMTGDLPSDPGFWETGVPLADHTWRYVRPSTTSSLTELMSRLLGKDEQDGGEQLAWPLPVFHVHIMLCAIQQIIFNLQVSMALENQAERVLQGLDMWRRLWHETLERLTDEERKFLGVAKHVAGLAHLTRRIVEVAASDAAASSRYLRRIPSDSTRDLHEFLRTFVI